MATVETVYAGELRTRARHVKSGIEIITDAPEDNQGRGEAFSPTDLLAASLGSCMLTIMGIAAKKHNFHLEGTHITVHKVMAQSPRRVSEIRVVFTFPEINYSNEQKLILEKAAHTCPVALSLHPDIKQITEFNYADTGS